ncbi:acyltransferase [Shewanella marinintestina]|uniref:acyltransferase family protein n=1 Tax=Shewanella marinintestina TaxID=190305 RepID=UPI00200C3B90|nr:acyltransferase [Shewanella marinintestina]MCL1145219.1 acyltransferase [Shewanella marinintestina]
MGSKVMALKRNNNFDILRHFFAFCVVWHHYLVLNNVEFYFPLFELFNSDVAVKSFFFISGVLIWDSALRTENVKTYFLKRLTRIYPALLLVLSVCSLIFLFMGAEPLNVASYFSFSSVFLTFLQPCVNGIFDNNIICAVNGSLWTLKLEVAFYIIIAFAVYFFKSKRFQFIMLLSLISLTLDIAYSFGILDNVPFISQLSNQIFFKLYYFGAGVFYYNYKEYIGGKVLASILLLSFLLQVFFELSIFSTFLFVFSIVIILAFYTPYFNISKFGDISYGMYIFHFPLVQFLVLFEVSSGDKAIDFLLFFLVLVFISKMSWEYVEKKCLYRSK